MIASVYQSYPLLQAAWQSRNIAWGNHLSASGAFDTKLKGSSENGPTGFYQTYRQSIGMIQPTWWGGKSSAAIGLAEGIFSHGFWSGTRMTGVS